MKIYKDMCTRITQERKQKQRKMGRQNRKLIKNIRKLNEKEKTKQQESQILGQKPGNWTSNQRKEINERR